MQNLKITLRRLITVFKRLFGFILTMGLPILSFVFNIDTVEQLVSNPFVVQIINLFKEHIWGIWIILSGGFFVTYIICASFAYHDPISTGGYLSEFERTKIEEYYRMKTTLAYTDKNATVVFNVVSSFASNLCNRIVKLLNYNFGKDFSVCIKLLEITSARKTTSANEIKLRTLCRAGNDSVNRSDYDAKPTNLSENSDFLAVFNGDKCFSCNNLRAYKFLHKNGKRPYRNSSENFREGKYNSTIVVPIRLSSRYQEDTNQILGFLCLDYKKRLPRSLVRKMIPYMFAFSDSLYVPLEEVLSYKSDNPTSSSVT